MVKGIVFVYYTDINKIFIEVRVISLKHKDFKSTVKVNPKK